MPKYLITIVENEDAYTDDADFGAVMQMHGDFAESVAKDDAQALEFAKLCPAPAGYVELRPVWEFDAS